MCSKVNWINRLRLIAFVSIMHTTSLRSSPRSAWRNVRWEAFARRMVKWSTGLQASEKKRKRSIRIDECIKTKNENLFGVGKGIDVLPGTTTGRGSGSRYNEQYLWCLSVKWEIKPLRAFGLTTLQRHYWDQGQVIARFDKKLIGYSGACWIGSPSNDWRATHLVECKILLMTHSLNHFHCSMHFILFSNLGGW